MKFFVLFSVLLVQALALPTGETFENKETDLAETETKTVFLTEEAETSELTRQERSPDYGYGHGHGGHGGGLAGFAYGGHKAGTYVGRNEPCAKRSYKPEHKGHGYGHQEHKGYGHEHKGYGHEHKGYGHEHKGYGHEHKGYGHEHKGHGYGHQEHKGYGHEHKGYGHEHKEHGHGYGHQEHKGYGHEHKGHGGHGYGHGHGHGYKASEAESAADFVASSQYGHAAPAYGHHQGGHHGGYVQPSHHQVHSYGAHAPHVTCGSNLLVGCNVHSAKVPCVPSHGHGYGHQSAGHGYAAPAAHHGYAAPAAHHGYAAPAAHHGYAAPAKHVAHHGYRADDDNKEQPKEGENRSEQNTLNVDSSATNVSNGQTNNNQQHPGPHQPSEANKRDETIAAMKKIMEKVTNKDQASN